MNRIPPLVQAQQALAARSALLGAVNLAPAPAASTPPAGLLYLTVTIAGLARFPLNVPGDYLFVDSISMADLSGGADAYSAVTVKADTAPELPIKFERQQVRFPTRYSKLEFYNPNAEELTLTIYVGTAGPSFGVDRALPDVFTVREKYGRTDMARSTRPANVIAYAANQVVCSTFFAYNIFRQGEYVVRVRKARLWKSATTTTNANFRLYLFEDSTYGPFADQTAFALLTAIEDTCLGVIDFPAFETAGAGSDCSFCELADIDIRLTRRTPAPDPTTTDNLYGILVAQAAYAPASGEIFDLRLDYDQG